MRTAEQVAGTIRKARLRLGLSQEAAAEMVGVVRLQWIRWEKGVNVPSEEKRARLAEVLGVPEVVLAVDEPAPEDDPLTRQVRAIVREEWERIRREEAAGIVA